MLGAKTLYCAGTDVRILYLVNIYPRTSHTFIRREILALVGLGFEFVRVSVRAPENGLIDASDLEDAARTHMLLRRGAFGLLPTA